MSEDSEGHQKEEEEEMQISHVRWIECMPYERANVVNGVKRWISNGLLASDEVALAEVDDACCVSGQQPEFTRGLILTGVASPQRQTLYEILEKFAISVVCDFNFRVRFAACLNDEVPDISISPLAPATATRAKRLWQLSYWAMRCGVLHEIAEARKPKASLKKSDITPKGEDNEFLDADAAASASDPKADCDTRNGLSSDEQKAAKKFENISKWHEEFGSPRIGLRRFASNCPTVYVFWASWDQDSIKFLNENVFPAYAGENAAPKPLPGASEDDPWLWFCCKFVDFRGFHSSVGENLVASESRLTLEHQSSKMLHEARHTRTSLPQIYRNFVAFGDAEVENDKDEVVPVEAPEKIEPASTSTRGRRKSPATPTKIGTTNRPVSKDNNRESSATCSKSSGKPSVVAAPQIPKKKRRRSIFSQTSAKQSQSHAYARAVLKAAKNEGRVKLRLGHIVLINVDDDASTGYNAFAKLQSRLDNWRSSSIALHSMHAGPGGLHSHLGSYFDISALPYICAAQPVRGRTIFGAPPRIVNLYGGDSTSTRLNRRVAQTALTLPPPISTSSEKVLWHELPRAERTAFTDELLSIISSGEGRFVLDIQCGVEFEPYGPRVPEGVLTILTDGATGRRGARQQPTSDLAKKERVAAVASATSHVSASFGSVVVLRGICSEPLWLALKPVLRRLHNKIRNLDLTEASVMESAAPTRIPVNPRTPEHIVRGWGPDVSCSHCDLRIFLADEPHFTCLYCESEKRTVCESCILQHNPSHVLLLIHKGSQPTVSTMWAASNVSTLPLVRGRLVVSDSEYHVGVYCNACLCPIKGVRWKCACCFDADLCNSCFGYWFQSAKADRPDRRHCTSHEMLRVSCAVPGNSSLFLAPKILPLTLESFADE